MGPAWGRILLGCLCALAGLPVQAAADTVRLHESATVLGEILSAPDKGIPHDLLKRAECVVIVPGALQGAFVVGAKYGRGYAVCRQPKGIGWGSPGAVRMEGGSFGFQIGGSQTDVVLLVMNRHGMDRLLDSKFMLGGTAEVAAGPVGRSSSADTDAGMTAKILSYSRSRGIFGGMSLQGATLRQDLEENERLYGRHLSNKAILPGYVRDPAVGTELVAVLNKYSSRK